MEQRHTLGHLLTLEEIHQRELKMLKLFVKICEEHDLKYYLAGGTLLGAVRHQGFIPWDDDIDVLMPRPEYERFQELVKDQPLRPEYEFHSSALGNLLDPFCKMFDLSTRVDKDWVVDKYDCNLWIDIFPIDGLPEDDGEIERIYRKMLAARRRLRFMKAKTGTGKSKLKIIVKPLLKPFALLLFGKNRTVRYMDRTAKTYPYENSRFVGGVAFGYGPQEKMVRADYEPQVDVMFEGCVVKAPACYDYYLRALYGDYMEFPPEDKRQVHFMKIYG